MLLDSLLANRKANIALILITSWILILSTNSYDTLPASDRSSGAGAVSPIIVSTKSGIRLNMTARVKPSQATACESQVTLEHIKNFSMSQDQEDQFLFMTYFGGLCGGTYVELGGLDGVRFSNSHLFHHGLGWKGVLIEPNPNSFADLKSNRPKDDTFNFAVCSKPSEVTFVDSGAGPVTGVLEFMTPSFIDQWHKEGGKQTKIRCEPLSTILEQSSLDTAARAIDFLSLDVEGAEFEVLKTVDFDSVDFGVIFYEADEHNPLKNQAMITFLEERGYMFREHKLRSNFHVNIRWHHVYDVFL